MAGRPPGRKKREIKPIVDIDYEAMARKTLEQTQLYYRLFTGRLTEAELDKFYLWAPENVRKQFPRERFTNEFLAGMLNKERLAAAVKSLPAEKKKEIESVTWKMADAAAIANCRLIFMEYVKRMWGKDFIPGHHFDVLAKCFEKCVDEGNKRYIINIAPRRGKSEFASYLFPSWYLGRRPKGKVIQVSNIKSLAGDFGQKIRNLMATDDYETIFGNVTLNADSKAKDKFNTNHGGSYFSVGTGGTITGRGADCAYFSCKCMTPRGMISLSEIKVGDFVYGYNHETARAEWTRVRAISTQRKPRLTKIGRFVCTPDHKVFDGEKYERADRVDHSAVLAMREKLSKEDKGILSGYPSRSNNRGVCLFLQHVMQERWGNVSDLSAMRGEESAKRNLLPEVLLRWVDRAISLFSVWGLFRQAPERDQEIFTAPGKQSEGVLLKRLLRFFSLRKTQHIAAVADGGVPDLLFPLLGEEEVLFKRLLPETEGFEQRIRWRVDPKTKSGNAAGQGCLRVLRTNEAENADSSYQPRCNGSRYEEFDRSVPAVPQSLSSHRVGVCARDLEPLLQGEGHWVVDIQTDTHNFFCEGVLAHNCLIIDDPHSERETIDGDMEPPTRDDFEKAWSWYNTIRPRLQPNGSIIIVMQRWSTYDLTGRLLDLAKKNPGADQWEVITLPALIEKRDAAGDILYDDKKEPIWESTWPQYWTTDMMLKMRANLYGIPNGRWRWECMYQQNVGAEEVSLVKRGSWKRWTKEKPPKCDFVIQSWDMATSDDARANYSACTTWGVFNVANQDDKPVYNIILLHAKRGQWKFHDLKTVVLNQYHRKDGVPDILLIEKKSAGVQVIQELQRMGIPVSTANPHANRHTGHNDKYSRLNLVTSLFDSGMVWAPETDWAEEVIDEVSEFPAGMYDDYVDSMTQALQRFRNGGFIRYETDEKEDDGLTFDKRPVRYY